MKNQNETNYMMNSDANKNFFLTMKNKHIFYRNILEKEEDYHFDGFVENIKKGLEIIKTNKEINDNSLSILLINENLPIYIEKILSRRYINYADLKILIKSNDFFNDIILFCLEMMDNQFYNVLEIFKKIFNSNKSYYNMNEYRNLFMSEFKELILKEISTSNKNNNGLKKEEKTKDYTEINYPSVGFYFSQDQKNEEIENEEKEEDKLEYPFKETKIKQALFSQPNVSPLLLIKLNVFEKNQGFDNLIKLIKNSSSASQIIIALDIFRLFSFYFEKEYYNSYLSNIIEDIKNIPSKINDEEIKNSKTTEISELLNTIEGILDKFYSDDQLKELLETMELNLYLMCLKSQYLEKRILGLNNIIKKIRETKYKTRIDTSNTNYRIVINSESSNTGFNKNNDFKNINSEHILNWLEKENVFDVIFGESIHNELVTRSLPILTFLYENNCFNQQKIEKIFELAFEKHDAYRNSITKLLVELVEIMKINDLKVFYQKLSEIPLKNLTIDIFILFKSMIHNKNLIKPTINSINVNNRTQNQQNQYQETELKELKLIKCANEFGPYPNLPINVNSNDVNEDYLWVKEETYNDWDINPNINESIEAIEAIDKGSDIKLKIVSYDEKTEENKINNENEVELKTADFFNLNKDLLNHIWNIINTATQTRILSNNILEEALKNLIEILNKSDNLVKFDFLNKIIDSISHNNCIHESIKILECIFKGNFQFEKPDKSLIRNKLELIEYLEKEFSLTNEILTSIIILKKSFVNYVINQNSISPNSDLNETNMQQMKDSVDEKELNTKKIDEKKSSKSRNKVGTHQMEEEKKEQRIEKNKDLNNDELLKTLISNNCDNESRSNDIQTQPTKGDKETLSISTDASSFEDLNSFFDKNRDKNLTNLFDNNRNNDKTLDNEATIYIKEIEYRLNFLRNIFQISFELVEIRHVKILWDVLVINCIGEQEKDLFFSFFQNIIYISKDYFSHLKEEVVYYLYFDILLQIDKLYYNYKAFLCLETFFLFINKEANLIKIENDENFIILNQDLVGLETIWEIFLHSIDNNVSKKAGELIVKIFKFNPGNEQLGTELKSNYLDLILNNLKNGLNQVKMNNIEEKKEEEGKLLISRSLDIIIKLIDISEGLTNKVDSKNEKITIIIMNQINNAMPPKKFEITLNNKLTLFDAKKEIGKKLNPEQKPGEILIMVRGSILNENNKTLKELKIDNKLTFFITKQTFSDDEFQAKCDPGEITQKVNDLKSIFSNLQDNIIIMALEKHNYNEGDTAFALSDDYIVNEYKEEILRIEKEQKDEKNKHLFQNNDPKENENISNLIANSEVYFEIFFEILNLEINSLNIKTWSLLNKLPLNQTILTNIRKIFSKNKQNAIDWKSIFDLSQPFKTLYSLKIIHSIISCGYLDEKEFQQEINERKEWREKFLEQNGFSTLYNILFSFNLQIMISKTEKTDQNNCEVQNLLATQLYLIIDILKIYIHSYLLSSVSDNLFKYVNQAIKFKDNLRESNEIKQIVIQNIFFTNQIKTNNQSLSNSYSMTPNFHSPNTSKSATPHCTTPPIIEKDADNVSLNKSSIFNNTKDNSILYDEFSNLTKQTSEKYTEKIKFILASNENLLKKILEIISECSFALNSDKEFIFLVDNCYEILFPLIMAQPELLITFYEFENLDKIILNNLIFCKIENIRKSLTFIINSICTNFKEKYFQNKIAEFINKKKIKNHKEKKEEKFLENDNILDNYINNSFDNNDKNEEFSSHSFRNELDESFGKSPIDDFNKEDEFQDQKITKYEEPKIFFLKLLIPHLFKICFINTDFEDYFICLSNLIKMNSKENIELIFKMEETYEKIVDFIIDREIIEDRYKENEDKLIAGFLLLAKTLTEIEPILKEKKIKNQSSVVPFIYEFLFYTPKENTIDENEIKMPKFKKKNTRKRAFDFLIELCDKCEQNFLILLPLIIINHEKLAEYDYESCNCEIKVVNSFVGLKNLGCTCYINSLLQQLFMITTFRYCIYNSEIPIELVENNKIEKDLLGIDYMEIEGENQKNIVNITENNFLIFNEHFFFKNYREENVLYQLKLLFSNLKENIKQYVIPQQFINAIKSYDGQNINVHIQQDVNEFFNLLSDKLEQNLKNSSYNNLLQEVMGGKLSHEIISLEEDSPYYGNREEPYFTISLEIKNKKNIYDALDLYVKGEILEGENKYFCEKYNKKIKVLKRCLIKSLPNTLIITLKRFEFNYNLMQKVKINDYFEFPTTLNMKKWTKEGILENVMFNGQKEEEKEIIEEKSDSYYEYELVGVLVHSGTAEAGHYYSYIKDRDKNDGKWYEFNDIHVNTFNINNLKNECFGGEYDHDEIKNFIHDWDNNKSRNAYLLFYEKKVPEYSVTIEKTPKNISKLLYELVWKQNLNYLRARLFYDVDYFNFVKDFVCLYDFPNETDVDPIISFSEDQLNNIKWMYENKVFLKLNQNNAILKEEDIETETNQTKDILNKNGLDYYLKTPALQTIKLATMFSYDSFIKTKDVQAFLGCIHILKPLFENYLPACFWFINYVIVKKEILIELLFEMNYFEAKTAFGKLLTIIINNVFKKEENYLLEVEKIERIEITNDFCTNIKFLEIKKSCLLRFTDVFCDDLLNECKKNLTKSLDYLQIIKYIIQLNFKISVYFVRSRIFRNLIEIFMNNAPSSSFYYYQSSNKASEKITENHLIPFLEIISLILRVCTTSGIQEIKQYAPTSIQTDKECPMLDGHIEQIFIDRSNFMTIFLPMQQFCDWTAIIAKHLSWGDIQNSRFFLETARENLCSIQTSWNQIEQIFRVVDGILKLEDIYQKDRIIFFFEEKNYHYNFNTFIESIYKNRDLDKASTIISIKCIAELGVNCNSVTQYMKDNIKIFKWMVEYLINISNQGFVSLQTPHLPKIIPPISNKLIEILNLHYFQDEINEEKKVIHIENEEFADSDTSNEHNIIIENININDIEQQKLNEINFESGGEENKENNKLDSNLYFSGENAL